MEIIALVAMALLCVAFQPTRLFGLILLGLLLFAYPHYVLPVLILAGIGLFYYHRRNKHDLPRLLD